MISFLSSPFTSYIPSSLFSIPKLLFRLVSISSDLGLLKCSRFHHAKVVMVPVGIKATSTEEEKKTLAEAGSFLASHCQNSLERLAN